MSWKEKRSLLKHLLVGVEGGGGVGIFQMQPNLMLQLEAEENRGEDVKT